MTKHLKKYRVVLFVMLILLTGLPEFAQADFQLTEAEKNYIQQERILKVASSNGAAPLSYTDSLMEMPLSAPFIEAETILVMNASKDLNHLDRMFFARG